MWSSELDVLFGKGTYTLDSSTVRPITNSTDTSYQSDQKPVILETGPVTVSPEMVNYMLALIIYSLRYASVYWYTNASFSGLFAFILLVCSMHHMFGYCGMGILYKFGINLHAFGGLSLVLSPTAVMVLYVLSCVVMVTSMLCVFNYGYCHYVECCRDFLKVHFPTYARYVAKMPVGCHGYVPHGFASVFLIIFIALRAPVVYDYVTVYRLTAFPIVLTCIVIEACYMLLWIGLWFSFTIKQTWDFKVNPQMDIVQQSQRNSIAMTPRQNGHIPQAEVTVIGSTARTDINRNRNDTSIASAQSITSSQTSSIPQKVSEAEKENNLNHSKYNQVQRPQRESSIALKEDQPPAKPPRQPEKPKLKPLNLEANPPREDSMEPEPQTPISPTSALKKSGLRKSGERRSNQARVTFDDSVDKIVDDEVSNLTSGVSNHPLQQSPRRKKKPKDIRLKYQKQDSQDSGRSDKSDNKSGGTPENTLTRNYRSSLRDKCGQYYKQLGNDLVIPPAAQSSPRPKERPMSDSYEPQSSEEILLNPLTVDNRDKEQSRLTDITGSMLSPVRPIPNVGDNTRDYNDPATRNDNRLRDPKRLSGRKSNDDSKAYSFPPKLYSQTSKTDSVDLSKLYDSNTGNNGFYIPNDINSKNKQTYSVPTHSPNSNSTNSTSYDSYYPNLYNDSSHIGNNSPSFYERQKYGPAAKSKNLPPHLIRPLNISTKPDLNRRDSALPSSNETSSNDSAEHMLCSQV